MAVRFRKTCNYFFKEAASSFTKKKANFLTRTVPLSRGNSINSSFIGKTDSYFTEETTTLFHKEKCNCPVEGQVVALSRRKVIALSRRKIVALSRNPATFMEYTAHKRTKGHSSRHFSGL